MVPEPKVEKFVMVDPNLDKMDQIDSNNDNYGMAESHFQVIKHPQPEEEKK